MGILTGIQERAVARVAESRSTGLTWDDSSLKEAFGVRKTRSGVAVTEKSALTLSPVYAAVRRLAEDVAKTPRGVFERLERGRDRRPSHRVDRIVSFRPNPEMTAFTFFEALQGHLPTWGNAFAEIERDNAGRPLWLWPLTPDKVRRERDPVRGIVFWVQVDDGTEVALSPDRVLHVPGFGFDGGEGYSVIKLARESLGLTAATEAFGAQHFGSGSHPIGVLQAEHRFKDREDKEKLRKDWDRFHTGLDNSHRVAILDQGIQWQQIGIAPEDSQFLETRKFQVTEVARWFLMPPHKLMDLERATFCLPGDTAVFTVDGPRRIDEVRAGDRVWSLDQSAGWVRSTVRRSECTGQDEILTIRTTNRTVRMNARHRVLARRPVLIPRPVGVIGGVVDEHGRARRKKWVTRYVPAGELQVGDTIVNLHGLPAHGTDEAPTRKASVGFMEFLGLYIGDGNKAKNYVAISRAENAPYMGRYRRVIREEFTKLDGGNGRGDQSRVPRAPVHLTEGERYTRFASVEASEEMSALGLDGTAYTKSVPGWIYRLTDELQLAFLRGFLDADGSVDKKGRVSFSSCNRTLLSGVWHLCVGLGIPVTNMRLQEGETTLPNGQRTEFAQWSFTCSDPGANRRIGSHTPEYVRRMESGKPFDRKGRAYPRHGGKGFNTPGCELARIVSIERGDSEPVYDLCVAETHSFVADGVVVHNSNIEQQGIEYIQDTLLAWFTRWEQVLGWDLFSEAERGRFYVRHNQNALLRGDSAARAQFYREMFGFGAFSPNDIRELEDMNPVENGDTRFVPLNFVPLDDATEPRVPPPVSEDEEEEDEDRAQARVEQRIARSLGLRVRLRQRHQALFEREAAVVLRREVDGVRAALRRAFGGRDIADLIRWVDEFYAEHDEWVASRFLAAIQVYGAAVADAASSEAGVPIPEELDRFMCGYADTMGRRWTGASAGQIRALIHETDVEEVEAAVEQRLEEWQDKRPAKEAAREVVEVGEAVSAFVWAAGGVVLLRWVAFGDACPLCEEMNGRTVGVEGQFLREGDELDPDDENTAPLRPSSNVRHPPLHKGCQCAIVPG